MYKRLIIEICGCNEVEANAVERIMRDTYRTLDNLSRAEFRRESRKALKLLTKYPTLLDP